MIYAAFATGGASAWHYWWTESLLPNGASNPPAQLYALGNFSKFARPGYMRIDVTGAPTPSASAPLVVAFANPADGTVAIVVVNGGSAQPVSFFVAGSAWPSSVTPYITSATAKLTPGQAISLTAARFSATLDAQSVTTFVGKPSRRTRTRVVSGESSANLSRRQARRRLLLRPIVFSSSLRGSFRMTGHLPGLHLEGGPDLLRAPPLPGSSSRGRRPVRALARGASLSGGSAARAHIVPCRGWKRASR